MATHSSILAWEIPWTEQPGGLHTVHRVTKSQTRLGDPTVAAAAIAGEIKDRACQTNS